MARTISDFKGNFRGGARPNLFKCIINFPQTNTQTSEKASFMIKGASLPGSTIGEVAVPFRGRNFYVAGDRTFEPWEITVINDLDFSIRNEFESWIELISASAANVSTYAQGEYYTDMEVNQLDRDGAETGSKTYRFIDVFPTAVSAIELSAESENSVEDFTVSLRYQYWTSDTTVEF